MTNRVPALDRVFHALSDPTRRAIVARLSKQPATVGEVHDPSAMALPTLLQHIRVLEQSGLVATRKVGRVRTCEVRTETLLATERWLAKQRAAWEARLDQFDACVITLQPEEPKRGKRKGQKQS